VALGARANVPDAEAAFADPRLESAARLPDARQGAGRPQAERPPRPPLRHRQHEPGPLAPHPGPATLGRRPAGTEEEAARPTCCRGKTFALGDGPTRDRGQGRRLRGAEPRAQLRGADDALRERAAVRGLRKDRRDERLVEHRSQEDVEVVASRPQANRRLVLRRAILRRSGDVTRADRQTSIDRQALQLEVDGIALRRLAEECGHDDDALRRRQQRRPVRRLEQRRLDRSRELPRRGAKRGGVGDLERRRDGEQERRSPSRVERSAHDDDRADEEQIGGGPEEAAARTEAVGQRLEPGRHPPGHREGSADVHHVGNRIDRQQRRDEGEKRPAPSRPPPAPGAEHERRDQQQEKTRSQVALPFALAARGVDRASRRPEERRLRRPPRLQQVQAVGAEAGERLAAQREVAARRHHGRQTARLERRGSEPGASLPAVAPHSFGERADPQRRGHHEEVDVRQQRGNEQRGPSGLDRGAAALGAQPRAGRRDGEEEHEVPAQREVEVATEPGRQGERDRRTGESRQPTLHSPGAQRHRRCHPLQNEAARHPPAEVLEVRRQHAAQSLGRQSEQRQAVGEDDAGALRCAQQPGVEQREAPVVTDVGQPADERLSGVAVPAPPLRRVDRQGVPGVDREEGRGAEQGSEQQNDGLAEPRPAAFRIRVHRTAASRTSDARQRRGAARAAPRFLRVPAPKISSTSSAGTCSSWCACATPGRR